MIGTGGYLGKRGSFSTRVSRGEVTVRTRQQKGAGLIFRADSKNPVTVDEGMRSGAAEGEFAPKLELIINNLDEINADPSPPNAWCL